MAERNRGIAMAGCGLLILALNVIDAADRGASAGNIVAIALRRVPALLGVHRGGPDRADRRRSGQPRSSSSAAATFGGTTMR